MSFLVDETLKVVLFPFEALRVTVNEKAFPVSGSIVAFFARSLPIVLSM